MKNSQIEIQFSRKKLLQDIGISILFAIFAIWVLLWGRQPIGINPMDVKGIGLFSLLFFGALGIIGLKKLWAIRDKKFGLIIGRDGIFDDSRSASIGLIEWSDITGIRMGRTLFSKFLLIDTNSPEKYIQKAKNKMKAKFMRIDMKKYGTPLAISTSNLNCDFAEFEELIKREFKKKK